MSPREAELEETVTQLRRLLHVEPERVKVDKLQVALRLGRTPATILAALHDAGSTWLPIERIEMLLPANDDARTASCVRAHISTIRDKIGDPDAVLCHYGVGYTLGASGVMAVRRVLEAT